MTKEDKDSLHRKWFYIMSDFEDKIDELAGWGEDWGILAIIILPICFVLKTIQWLSWIIGSWLIKMIPLSHNKDQPQ